MGGFNGFGCGCGENKFGGGCGGSHGCGCGFDGGFLWIFILFCCCGNDINICDLLLIMLLCGCLGNKDKNCCH